MYFYYDIPIDFISFSSPLDSSATLDAVPLANQNRSEIIELRVLTAACAKDIGNARLKEGDVDEAIRLYSCAISCDTTNHLL